MLTQALRTSPGVFSAIGLVSGFALIVTESLTLRVIGAILLMLAFFVPFIRMLLPEPEATEARTAKTARQDPATPPTSPKKPRRRTDEATEPQ